MRKFSRWMPPATHRKTPVTGRRFLAMLIAAALAATISWPVPAAVIASAFVAIFRATNRVTSRRLHYLAAERPGEDIGSFARAFNRRAELFDPWYDEPPFSRHLADTADRKAGTGSRH